MPASFKNNDIQISGELIICVSYVQIIEDVCNNLFDANLIRLINDMLSL